MYILLFAVIRLWANVKNTCFLVMYTLNCKGKLLTITKPLVMGIINVTPDSFYKVQYCEGVLMQHWNMQARCWLTGADILDIGGQSTRPGSERIDAVTETERVLPLIEAINKNYPTAILSIDTYHSKVASAAVEAGASIVNDISGGSMDAEMINTVAALRGSLYLHAYARTP
jgi:dihydropteroate synthase